MPVKCVVGLRDHPLWQAAPLRLGATRHNVHRLEVPCAVYSAFSSRLCQPVNIVPRGPKPQRTLCQSGWSRKPTTHLNRHDPAAFLSFFAPVWYHTVLEDTAAAPRRQVREENIRDYVAKDAFGNMPTITMTRRMVVGPYVIDEQVRGRDRTRHLDIFEVRQGKIVREWESGPLPKAP